MENIEDGPRPAHDRATGERLERLKHTDPRSGVNANPPPCDLDAEMAVLGSMMMERSVIDLVTPIIQTPEAFYANPRHRVYFQALLDLYENDCPIDLLVAVDWMKRSSLFEDGDPAYMATLADSFGDWVNAEHYAKIVAEKYQRRELIRLAMELANTAYDPMRDVSELANRYAGQIEVAAKHGVNGKGDAPNLIRLSDIQSERLEPLWPGRFYLGKLASLPGDPGLGKSVMTLDMAARLSRGTPWPDAPNVPVECGSTILLSGEDTAADTIRPRLEAAGADLSRIVILDSIRTKGSGKKTDRWVNLERDIESVERAIIVTGNVKLIIIDPISSYLGKIDSHKNSDVRGVLGPLAALASKHRVAIILVTHLSKSGGTNAVYRAIGSIGFVGAVRAAWLVTTDAQNPRRRLLLNVKNNLAPDQGGLAFSVEPSPADPSIPVVAWELGPVTTTANDALAALERDSTDRRSRVDECADWLLEQLAQGPVPAAEIPTLAEEAGFSVASLRRAKDRLRIKSIRAGDDWHWTLPGEDAQSSTHEHLEHVEHVEHVEYVATPFLAMKTEDAQGAQDVQGVHDAQGVLTGSSTTP